jgi:16S rRNA (cytosine967-C5)-methyltransferase
LRATTLVNTRDELIAALADEGLTARKNPRSPWAVDVVGRANLFGCRAFRDGRFEVQDASSQAVVVAADVRPGDVVVDLCAGRGGKTLALAAAMTDRGALWFHDVDERALADLRGRLLRARVTCARRGLPDDGTADVVLVDAPCSSTGVLRRWPDLRYTLRADDVEGYAGVQRALLARAARLVRPGGRVVYATCSVLRAENDAVVDDLIVNDIFDRIDPRLLHDGSHDRPTTTRGEPALITQSRTLLAPREPGDGDGFFFAVLLRTR